MKPVVAGLALGLGLAAASLAVAAPPWDGTYVYEQALGPGAGGTQNFVTHTLTISGPEGCRLVAQGFQTDETLRCKAMPDGDRLLVSFVSFGTGKVENKYGVKLYSPGQPLFAISQAPNGFVTTWQGYAKAAGEGATSDAFKKVGR
ncbi:DUF5991 domain-containing protein [Reyranella sp.]|uniref:DUF5991 domain-containing protein n=1 Tax=Reyranella sp. TaxID=1929291 RepID=UPI003BA9E3E4